MAKVDRFYSRRRRKLTKDTQVGVVVVVVVAAAVVGWLTVMEWSGRSRTIILP